MKIIILTFIISLVSAWVVLFISKIGLRNKVIERSPIRLISELFECDFCLCWWTNVLLCIIASIYFHSLIVLLVAVIATPITRHLL